VALHDIVLVFVVVVGVMSVVVWVLGDVVGRSCRIVKIQEV